MNRDQKATAIAEIADSIASSEAVFAVDYRGISVAQAAALRARLREADTSFRVVKNTLTERAADQVDAVALKPLLEGPTALAFVRGDAAVAAKAISTLARETETLAFKGGVLNGAAVDADQIAQISRLPARDVLYGQLVGVVASPVSGLVRTLNALIAGIAVQLGQIAEKKASGELPAGAAPAASQEAPAAAEGPAESAADAGDGDQDAEAPEHAVSSDAPVEGPADDEDSTTSTDEHQADASAQADVAEAPKED